MKEFLKTILWATDFSEESKVALSHAAHLAKAFGSRLVALHVIPDFSPILYECYGECRAELSGTIAKSKADAEAKLAEWEKSPDVHFEKTLVIPGSTAQVIVETATKEKANLIVIGRKGFSDHEKTLIGGVAHQILRSTPVPVLVTHRQGPAPGVKKILVPTDFTAHEDVERNYAWKLAKGLDASICLLYVMELFGHDFRLADEMFDAVMKKLKSRRRKEHEDIEITEDVTRAVHAYEGIIDYAETKGYGMIVMSTQVRKFARFFLGSTTEKVVTLSTLPVFAIPPDRD